MKLEIIKKDLCTQFGAELPIYQSNLENSILFVWD